VLGFPTPYANELLYSTIARAGIHDGEMSPKQLLDSVFSNRKVIATVDLPSHIQDIADQYPKILGLDVTQLINSHTLLPMYEPFVPTERIIAIRNWMGGVSLGAVHLASGIVASRIKTKEKLLLCEECVSEHRTIYGEAYWDRRWHVPLVKYCIKHGPLFETDIELNGNQRHAYRSILEVSQTHQLSVTESDVKFSNLAYQLIDYKTTSSPSFAQWTVFYRKLAVEYGFQLGNRIDHRKIDDHYNCYWDKAWLANSELLTTTKDTSWLKGIFRKHRKSFSFAEHLTVIDAISSGCLSIEEAINRAKNIPVQHHEIKKEVHVKLAAAHTDQFEWVDLLKDYNPKAARLFKPALYARLYRNHYNWLMIINEKNKGSKNYINDRVDWSQRDRRVAKTLLRIINTLEQDLSLPRFSRAYLLKKLTPRATIEKNLHKLPRTLTLLERYSECIDEYQARRLTRAIILLLQRKEPAKPWLLLREAGLSPERMTHPVNKLLEEILKHDSWRKIQTY
jgi:hypothetical protein